MRDRGGQIFTARDLRGLESPAQLAPMLGSIRQRLAQHGHPPVYLTLDIDCLDPAYAPGTGTPEPGGLSTNQVLTVLEELTDLPFVGMDCVEVAPAYDHAELTSAAAATLRLDLSLRPPGRGALSASLIGRKAAPQWLRTIGAVSRSLHDHRTFRTRTAPVSLAGPAAA